MKIAVIGAGNMGMAFSSAFVRKGLIESQSVLLVEPHTEMHNSLKQQGFSWILPSVSDQVSYCDIVILAVKPQDFPVLASNLKEHIKEQQIILSIMAGIDIATISQSLGTAKIVRSMPNTPAKLGVGITGFYYQGLLDKEAVLVQSLLESTGKAVLLQNESLLNAVTALSGSGPAYFYYFLRSMVEAGMSMGVPEEMAKQLACETMLGSYHLIQKSETSFDDLIKAVASKGGTTEAALSTFESFKVAEGIKQGLMNAEERAKQLSQMLGNK